MPEKKPVSPEVIERAVEAAVGRAVDRYVDNLRRQPSRGLVETWRSDLASTVTETIQEVADDIKAEGWREAVAYSLGRTVTQVDRANPYVSKDGS